MTSASRRPTCIRSPKEVGAPSEEREIPATYVFTSPPDSATMTIRLPSRDTAKSRTFIPCRAGAATVNGSISRAVDTVRLPLLDLSPDQIHPNESNDGAIRLAPVVKVLTFPVAPSIATNSVPERARAA